jgi:hypothetical protein
MDASLILIDSNTELARARALVDQLWDSKDPADIARLEAQARLIAAYATSWISTTYRESTWCRSLAPQVG